MSKLIQMLADEYNWQVASKLLIEDAYVTKSNMQAFKAFEALSDAIDSINKLRSE